MNRPCPVQLGLVDVCTGPDHLERRGTLSILNQPGQLTREFLSPVLPGNEWGSQNTRKNDGENETLHTSSRLNDIRIQFVVIPPQAFRCGIEELIGIFPRAV